MPFDTAFNPKTTPNDNVNDNVYVRYSIQYTQLLKRDTCKSIC